MAVVEGSSVVRVVEEAATADVVATTTMAVVEMRTGTADDPSTTATVISSLAEELTMGFSTETSPGAEGVEEIFRREGGF